MMKTFMFVAASLAMLGLVASPLQAADKPVPAALKFKMKSIDGKQVDLAKFQGRVVLVVNLASQ